MKSQCWAKLGRGSIHHQPNIEESKLSLGNINDWAVREMISTGETSLICPTLNDTNT